MAEKKSDSKKQPPKNKNKNSKKNPKPQGRKQSKKTQPKNQPKKKFNNRRPKRHVRINKQIEGRTGIVYIGNEDSFIYFPDILSFLSRDNIDSVILKSRGRAINVAVDVAEQIRNRFSSEVKSEVKNVEIGTEEVTFDNKKRRVSFINIEMIKQIEKEESQEDNTKDKESPEKESIPTSE